MKILIPLMSMISNRLIYRNRTRKLIAEMLTFSVDEQMRFFGFDTRDQLDYKLERIRNGLANTSVDYVIFDLIKKESNIVIGSCGFHKWIKDHNRSEIGYEIFPTYQNQGYMTEALVSVIHYGFDLMGLNRIEALVSPNNAVSIAVITKNGFSQEGVLRGHYKVDDKYEDSVIYSLLRSDINQQ